MRRRTADTAILIALLLKRSGNKRSRISDKTLRTVSGRRTIRSVFVDKLKAELEDIGIHLIELDRGGFGLILSSVLDGAPAITAKRFILDEIKAFDSNPEKAEKFRREIEEVTAPDEEDDG
jgi:hypothetical protein